MRVIGIDPGTGKLGFGVIDIKNSKFQLIEAGIITTPAHTPLDDRLVDIFDNLMEIIDRTKPNFMSIEKIYFAQNVTTAISVSHARGVAMLAGKKSGLEITEYTPLQIKQAIAGYGRATKQQMQEMVRLNLNLKTAPKPDDCADALATAITHYLMTRV
ncbi:MAG: crossover junction endodeoxyribonuclease RuvC [Candidatus Saccharimonadales bacterium]